MPSATTRTNHTLRSETKDDTRKRDKGAAPRAQDGESEMGGSADAADCVKHWENMVEDGTRRYKEFKNRGERNGGKASGKHQEEYAVRQIKDVSSDSESGEDEYQGESKEEYTENRHRRKREHGGEQRMFNKKQKDNKGDGKQDDAPGQPGSKGRLPKKESIVHWKALPGFVEGEVVDIVYEEKTVDGKAVKGKPDDPRIVLKSSSSGKIAVHKPEAVYFE